MLAKTNFMIAVPKKPTAQLIRKPIQRFDEGDPARQLRRRPVAGLIVPRKSRRPPATQSNTTRKTVLSFFQAYLFSWKVISETEFNPKWLTKAYPICTAIAKKSSFAEGASWNFVGGQFCSGSRQDFRKAGRIETLDEFR